MNVQPEKPRPAPERGRPARSAYAKTLECELHALVRITCCGLEGRAPRERRVRPHSNTLLKDRILFGSDNPVILPDRWLAEFEKLPIKPEVRPLILKENAAKLLGLK